MAIIEWSSKYLVDIEQLDQQHRKLFEVINSLHDAMKLGKGKEQIGETISFLNRYTCEHFEAEESLMKKHNYPAYSKQKLEHDNFVKYLKEFEEKFKSGALSVTLEVMSFLSNWLKSHILKEDFAYKNFFAEKNLSKK